MNILALALTSVFVMSAPFVIIALWFFVRKHRKELKAMKKSIKSGDWARDFEYKMNSKTQSYLDKLAKKHYKTKNKLDIKNTKKAQKLMLQQIESRTLSAPIKEEVSNEPE